MFKHKRLIWNVGINLTLRIACESAVYGEEPFMEKSRLWRRAVYGEELFVDESHWYVVLLRTYRRAICSYGSRSLLSNYAPETSLLQNVRCGRISNQTSSLRRANGVLSS